MKSLRELDVALPQKMVLQKHGKGRSEIEFRKLKVDDFTSSPSMSSLRIEQMVDSNQVKRKNKEQIDIRQLFLLTKSVGNFQLALRNYRTGKLMSDNDEIKVRNLVNHRMGKTHSQSHRQSVLESNEKSLLKDRCYNLIRSISNINSTDNQTERATERTTPKSQFIHHEDLKKLKEERSRLKFKGFKVQASKFKRHLRKSDEVQFYSEDYSSNWLL